MSKRFNRIHLLQCLRIFAERNGLMITGSEGASMGELHYVGSVYLDYSQSRSGWRVLQITSASGAVQSLTGARGYMTAGTLAAWFDGVEFAQSQRSSCVFTLSKHPKGE